MNAATIEPAVPQQPTDVATLAKNLETAWATLAKRRRDIELYLKAARSAALFSSAFHLRIEMPG